jgi:hypothetical protein
MKAYLGIVDTDSVYEPEKKGSDGKIFGVGDGQQNFARVRVA